jgi:hypothetical protein
MFKDSLEITGLRACELKLECVSAIVIAFIVLLVVGSLAYAQKAVETGRGIVCDTPDQVVRYLNSNEDDGTLEKVNEEGNTVCSILSVAFFLGEKGEQVTNALGTWVVMKILIVGVDTPHGIHPISPVTQYTAVYVETKGA